MALKYPDSDVDFNVTPAYFLGDFDIYDREESLGEYLNKYDPNDPEQLHKVLLEIFFEGGRVSKLTVEHKEVLLKSLSSALKDENYNFQELVSHENDFDDCFNLPHEWDFSRPRFFFEEVYRMAVNLWGNELRDNGFIPLDFREVGVPQGDSNK